MENKQFRVIFILTNGTTRKVRLKDKKDIVAAMESLINLNWFPIPHENGNYSMLNKDHVKEIEIEEVK
jgi:hypothetical protein